MPLRTSAIRVPVRRTLRAAALMMVVGCGDAAAPSDGVIERVIAPSATNAAITRYNDPHYVWVAPAVLGDNRQLLVLLSGSYGMPSNFRSLGHIAAMQGWQVIGLMYPDADAIYANCGDARDSTCAPDVRTEIIDGIDASPFVNVDQANSISGRLASLLRYLASRYPAEGWDAYLSGGAPKWMSIAVGGLSQGGGHAAFIAKYHAVPRVVMFGSPTDGFFGEPAAWMTPGATDASRYYGFIHARDPFISEVPNWTALGMATFGAVTAVEGAAPPYGGTHMLITDLLPATGSYADAHASVFNDYKTPRMRDGSPVFADAWRYLIGAPAGTGGGGGITPSPRRAACTACGR